MWEIVWKLWLRIFPDWQMPSILVKLLSKMKAGECLEKWELFCKGSREYSRSQAKYKSNISHSYQNIKEKILMSQLWLSFSRQIIIDWRYEERKMHWIIWSMVKVIFYREIWEPPKYFLGVSKSTSPKNARSVVGLSRYSHQAHTELINPYIHGGHTDPEIHPHS